MINIKTKDLVLFDNDPNTKFKVLNAYRSFSINVTNTMRTYIKPYVIEAEHLIQLLNKELEE